MVSDARPPKKIGALGEFEKSNLIELGISIVKKEKTESGKTVERGQNTLSKSISTSAPRRAGHNTGENLMKKRGSRGSNSSGIPPRDARSNFQRTVNQVIVSHGDAMVYT